MITIRRSSSALVCILIITVLSYPAGWGQGAAPDVPVLSLAPSLEISFKARKDDQLLYAIRNNSQRAVRIFSISYTLADPSLPSGTVLGNIEPGAVREFNTYASQPRGGAVQMITITTAVFVDDTYEGDEKDAAGLAAVQFATDGQKNRIALLINRILADTNIDERAKASQIRTDLIKLSDEPDEATLRRFARLFPSLLQVDQPKFNNYYHSMKGAFTIKRVRVIRNLKQLTCGDYPAGTTLEQWWKSTEKGIQYGESACSSGSLELDKP
jgi:hypothetical protein